MNLFETRLARVIRRINFQDFCKIIYFPSKVAVVMKQLKNNKLYSK